MPATAYMQDAQDAPVYGARLAGGTAQALLQADGTVVVEDVPIFSEIRESDPGVRDGARTPRDRAWLETAIGKTRSRIAMGKLPIMNLRHIFEDPERVGTYEPQRCELAEVNPDEPPRWTVFGRKVYESRDAFEKSKDHDFRSVEISPDQPDEFGALALLRAKEPYHKFPNLRERLAAAGPGVPEAFAAECFRSRAGAFPQLWRGRVETFAADVRTAHECPMPMGEHAANDPYAIANAMLNKGQITKPQFDDVVSAIKRDSHEGKEGSMPATEVKKDDKTPSIEERMEAYFAKFEERLMKKFEERLAKVGGLKEDGSKQTEAGKKDEAGTYEAGEKKAEGELMKQENKTAAQDESKETHGAKGPDALLPPAVAAARPGEQYAAAPGAVDPKLVEELLGLRTYVRRKQAEEQVEQFAAEGEKALAAGGVQVDEEVRRTLRASATKGKQEVDGFVAGVLHYAKGAARAPEAFGAMAARPGALEGSDPDLKKAMDTYGTRPETKAKIVELYQGWRDMGEGFRRSVGSFFDVCQGHPEINPAILGERGGFGRKG